MRANAELMRDLKQLARLLRRRFAGTSGRAFVMLAVHGPRRVAICNTSAITQRIPLLRTSAGPAAASPRGSRKR